jgi:hypothetical protein
LRSNGNQKSKKGSDSTESPEENEFQRPKSLKLTCKRQKVALKKRRASLVSFRIDSG